MSQVKGSVSICTWNMCKFKLLFTYTLKTKRRKTSDIFFLNPMDYITYRTLKTTDLMRITGFTVRHTRDHICTLTNWVTWTTCLNFLAFSFLFSKGGWYLWSRPLWEIRAAPHVLPNSHFFCPLHRRHICAPEAFLPTHNWPNCTSGHSGLI